MEISAKNSIKLKQTGQVWGAPTGWNTDLFTVWYPQKDIKGWID